MQCNEDMDSVQIVDSGTRFDHAYVDVLGKHHGKEDVVRVEFESSYATPSDLQVALRAAMFFEPEHSDSGFSAGGV